MRMPGFTAESARRRSGRTYRTASGFAEGRWGAAVTPQQGEIEAPGTCCGHYCAGLCSCQAGHFYCSSSLVEEEPAMARVLAAGAVSMAGDSCHATSPVNGGYAIVFNCPCGCWASAHDAGCLGCHAVAETTPTYLKA